MTATAAQHETAKTLAAKRPTLMRLSRDGCMLVEIDTGRQFEHYTITPSGEHFYTGRVFFK